MHKFKQGLVIAIGGALLLLTHAEAQSPDVNYYGYSGEFLDGQSSDQYRLPNPNGTYGTPQQNAMEPNDYYVECDDEDHKCRAP